MKKHQAMLVLAIGVALCILSAQAQTKVVHRIIFALTSPDEADWQLTLNNVGNLISGAAPDRVEVEIVAYGNGTDFLKKLGPYADEIQKLESRNVRFIACGNAMKKQHLKPSDLVTGTEVVGAGIVEVVKKQEEGWTYIKAGR